MYILYQRQGPFPFPTTALQLYYYIFLFILFSFDFFAFFIFGGQGFKSLSECVFGHVCVTPFFGQCIFNIILQPLLAFPRSAHTYNCLSCRGHNFSDFYFGCVAFHFHFHIQIHNTSHKQQPCLQWACIYFFHICHVKSWGWSPPIGNCPVCRWPRSLHMRNALNALFLFFLFLFCVFLVRCGG